MFFLPIDHMSSDRTAFIISRLSRLSLPHRLGLCLAGLLVFTLGFFVLYPILQTPILLPLLLPVILVAIFFGFIPGALSPLLFSPLVVLLVMWTGESPTFALLSQSHWIEWLILIFCGGFIGRLRDLIIKSVAQADILKDTEKELRSSEAHYRRLLEISPDAIAVTDLKGNILFCNQQTANLLKAGAIHGVIGTNFFSAIPDETAAQIREQLAAQGEIRNYEMDIKNALGEPLTVELSISPIQDEQGQPTAVIGFLHDITHHKEIRLALEESEIRFRGIVEQSHDGIFLTDENGNIIEWNQGQEKIYGRKRDEVIGRPVWDVQWELTLPEFHTPEYKERMHIRVQNILETGQSHALNRMNDGTIMRPDGSIINVQDILFTIKTQHGYKLAGISRDVTETKNEEERMRKLYEAERKQRQLAEALRDINTRLSSTLDPQTVYDILTEQINRIIPNDSCALLLVENRQIKVVSYAVRPEYKEAGHALKLPTNLDRVLNLRTLCEKKVPLIVPDTRNYPGWVKIEGIDYIRAWLGAPILIQGEVAAIFSVYKDQVDFYTEEHATLLAQFAAQAALAIQNARLHEATAADLMQQERLNELTHTITSATDLNTILQNVTRLASSLLGSNASAIGLIEPSGDVFKYYNYNLPEGLILKTLPQNQSLSWQVVHSGQPVMVYEYPTHPFAAAYLVEAGLQSLLTAPVTTGDECLGVLHILNFKTRKRFTDRQVALAVSIGRQVGIAIQNARHLDNTRRRAEEAEMLRQSIADVSSALDLDEVLDKILINLEKVVPYKSSCVFLDINGSLRMVAGRGLPNKELILNTDISADDPLMSTIRAARYPVTLRDAQQDPRFCNWGDSFYIHSWMGVPLIAREQVIGFLTIDSEEIGVYGPAQAALALAFANQVAAAISNARLFKRVQDLATVDPLTGLFNRRHFFDIALQDFGMARSQNSSLVALMMDVDHFKRVNDTYGHQAGDQVLQTIAERLKRCLRNHDIICRYGGEEFTAILPGADLRAARAVAERLRLSASEAIETSVGPVTISLSLGVAALDESCSSLDELLKHADQALYVSKQMGKNRVSIWEQTSGAARGS
ncbi:MAG TPA: diguanylate cyclase [Anaerolineaceae bacterium]|nr:diguanylate cyclase [Anaerolineaceae bacterium]HPN52234.1 diguanylate cyclase [Anaerolineaceae bacterium]